MIRSLRARGLSIILVCVSSLGFAIQSKAPSSEADLAAAQQLYWGGKFAEAKRPTRTL
jgi:hypothetical protein